MDYWKCLFLLLSMFCLIKVLSSLTIQFDADGVGLLGSDTTLSCTFLTEDNEKVDRIVLTAKNVSENKFIEIAVFDPNIPISALTPYGIYLSSRVVLSNITSSSTVANLLFTSLECIDERDYECKISYNIDLIYRREQTKTTNVTVKANPSVPIFLWEVPPLTEGDNVTFTCVGNVGKPPEAFIWQIRYGGILADAYKNVTTSSIWLSDTCSYYGTSNLTIQVTDEDNNAKIRCSIHDLQGKAYYNESQHLNVKYKVRKPNITRQPMRDEYLEGPDGPGKIILTCAGRGNPQPTYTWYKDGNMNETLNTSSTLYITDVVTHNSGIYTCNASNTISGTEFVETTTVIIRIVEERTATTTTKATTSKHKENYIENVKEKDTDIAVTLGVVFGVVAVVIFVIIIGFIKYRRQRLTRDNNYDNLGLRDSPGNGRTYDGITANFRGDESPYENSETPTQSYTNVATEPQSNYVNQGTGEEYEYAYVNPANA